MQWRRTWNAGCPVRQVTKTPPTDQRSVVKRYGRPDRISLKHNGYMLDIVTFIKLLTYGDT